MTWTSVTEALPPEGEYVDVWLQRGRRATDCYWTMQTQGAYQMPMWWFRNGFSVWKVFQKQDITHWMKPPMPPDQTDAAP